MQFLELPAIGNPALVEHNFSLLKPREWKVLILLIDDFTNQDIMVALNLKRRTVINLRNSIGDKLNLKGAHTLAQFCRSNRELILCQYSGYHSKK
ncbi:LuxR C-terminal-related transcriptional regulator [Dyadobacter arcticus]|uniref:DNA-binding CsgD family transcriptional regulator n=1 Tax=Dyadobacter arcticus TaxID=1078754 RepID=A0ABX0UUD6_9BACT|nr:LuxR C-terminal-related transcriptional regulator [Dyadobacter arcticus]NIJ55370.1 DNA-binding CsgD family transcriptional regulator [Dyadobacter arcticus]